MTLIPHSGARVARLDISEHIEVYWIRQALELAPAGLENGFFFVPTVVEGLDADSRLIREGVFGPVLSVIPASSEQDAVRLANATTMVWPRTMDE